MSAASADSSRGVLGQVFDVFRLASRHIGSSLYMQQVALCWLQQAVLWCCLVVMCTFRLHLAIDLGQDQLLA